ncbi:MAG: hypothetical protein RLZZ591_364 [Pseudomonadota bacterium]|jgi:hypothetical protein
MAIQKIGGLEPCQRGFILARIVAVGGIWKGASHRSSNTLPLVNFAAVSRRQPRNIHEFAHLQHALP